MELTSLPATYRQLEPSPAIGKRDQLHGPLAKAPVLPMHRGLLFGRLS